MQSLSINTNVVSLNTAHYLIKFVWLTTGGWFCPGTPVSSNNKTELHRGVSVVYITEILLKVALNTITLTQMEIRRWLIWWVVLPFCGSLLARCWMLSFMGNECDICMFWKTIWQEFPMQTKTWKGIKHITLTNTVYGCERGIEIMEDKFEDTRAAGSFFDLGTKTHSVFLDFESSGIKFDQGCLTELTFIFINIY